MVIILECDIQGGSICYRLNLFISIDLLYFFRIVLKKMVWVPFYKIWVALSMMVWE
jgi:hypothetical protein